MDIWDIMVSIFQRKENNTDDRGTKFSSMKRLLFDPQFLRNNLILSGARLKRHEFWLTLFL